MKEAVLRLPDRDIGMGKAETWDDVAVLLGDWAENWFRREIPDGAWNNYTQRRAMCCDMMADWIGHDSMCLKGDRAVENDRFYLVLADGTSPPEDFHA